MQDGPAQTEAFTSIHVPLDRTRALGRALVIGMLAAVLGTATTLVYSRLDFAASGPTNRLVDYSLAAGMLPLAVVALIAAWKAMGALALALWPARMGISATSERLWIRLGPLGTHTYDARRLAVKYPFELLDDGEDESFESYLPEEEQMARFLPMLKHPDKPEGLKEIILRHAKGTESDVARCLRPAIDAWRSRGVE
jgi:hypothetical protein